MIEITEYEAYIPCFNAPCDVSTKVINPL